MRKKKQEQQKQRVTQPGMSGAIHHFDLGPHPTYPLYWRVGHSNPEIVDLARALATTCEAAGQVMADNEYGDVLAAAREPAARYVNPNDASEVRDVLTLIGTIRVTWKNHDAGMNAGLPRVLAANDKLAEWIAKDRSVYALTAWNALYFYLYATFEPNLIVLDPPFDGTNVVVLPDPAAYALAYADTITAARYGTVDDDPLVIYFEGLTRLALHLNVNSRVDPPFFAGQTRKT